MSNPKHTPGPWRFELGGGHSFNSIRGSDSVQVNGWRERRGGVSNASYSDRVCENLGNPELPAVAANARLIAAAPEMREALQETIDGGMAVKQQIKREERIRALLARIDGEDLCAGT